MTIENIFAALPEASLEEVSDQLLRRDGLKIERIVSHGQSSPEGFWYDQETCEWVVVLRGRAGLELEGRDGVVELGPGDFLDIPARRKHRVAWTAADEPTVWLAVHYGARIEIRGSRRRPVPCGGRRPSARRSRPTP